MSESPFLTARWLNLVMLTYEVEPALLGALVPSGTELDRFGGRVLASVVGFQFVDTRLFGIPVPGHRDFEELNLRFYVRREADTPESRHGVVFVKEAVPRLAIALVARATFNEPYVSVPMRSTVIPESATYSWRHAGRWHSIGASWPAPGTPPAGGSIEEFITVRHWGYTRQRDGTTLEYQVSHPRWSVANATPRVEADFPSFYGDELGRALTRPVSSLIADGSAIVVHRPRRLSRDP